MYKTVIVILGLAAIACNANPAKFERKSEYFGSPFARQELERTTTEQQDDTTTTASVGAPYPPAGYVYDPPSGRLLTLPSSSFQRQQQKPSDVYGTPGQEAAEPATEYGAPTETTTERDVEQQEPEASDASEGNETTDEPESEILPSAQTQQQVSAKQMLGEGVYFVQLADGSYQRVVYLTSGNLQSNSVAAKIQIQPEYVQSPPVYYNPFLVPRAVSYSSQYQSW